MNEFCGISQPLQKNLPFLSIEWLCSLILICCLVERNDPTALPPIVLLPMADIFLDQSLVEANDSLEQTNSLLTIIDLSRCELIH